MSLLTILTEEEQQKFDYPPILSAETRALCFIVTDDLEKKINQLRTPTNKVGFLIQYGYFRACKRFFVSNRYRQEDIDYAAKTLGITENLCFNKYINKIPRDHQKSILKLLSYQPFDEAEKQWVSYEMNNRVEQFTEPRELFLELLPLLHGRAVEIPSYHRLSDLITKCYLSFENKLTQIIEKHLSDKNKQLLDSLLIADKERSKGILNSFKVISQSVKPKAIQASINVFNQISDVFTSLLPVVKALSLTHQSCQYYATWVKKAKLSQINQFPDQNKKYLHLIAFIQNQHYLRQDSFIDIFMKSVQAAKNSCARRLYEADKLSRNERRAAVKHVTQSNREYRALVDEIKDIARSPVLTDSGKIEQIDNLLKSHEDQKNDAKQANIEKFEKFLDRIAKNNDYFDILEDQSIKLQRKVSSIVKALLFNADNSNNMIIQAINYFNNNDGNIDHDSPVNFLGDEEKPALLNDKSTFRVSLYKMLLFIHMMDDIKSGELNLKYSYRYLSIQDYLIDEETWKKRRDELLGITEMTKFNNVDFVISELKNILDEKYHTVNQQMKDGGNPSLSLNKEGFPHVTTPAIEEKETEYIAALLDQNGYVPVLCVLSDINKATNFSECFKHHSVKNIKRRPEQHIFHAGIIALGCNIGVPKMAHISSGINENTLANTVNWYFTRKSLHDANQRIVELIHQLSLSSIFVSNKDKEHSSSDGSKFNVAVESLLASYSFKYFGKDKGISVYTFIDERQALFNSLVMSTSEREAAYVIDGLNSTDVPNVDIHSTDTHGYTESIFAATHMLGISFAPRLKKVGKQRIYSFSSKSVYVSKGYEILPNRPINQKIIRKHWDDILRFMVTIKLKKISASQLFKRLSSYARNNPLYKAIKEFGRIIKSIFILTYFDDVELRQRIEKQLNRVEASNRFSNAVFYANSSAFTVGLSDEQEIAVNCKALIQNSIILWNYLYLSQLITNYTDVKERYETINLIRDGSVITWRHINLHGEFDFKRHAANENTFNMTQILSLSIN